MICNLSVLVCLCEAHWVDRRIGVDLKCVDVITRVLEQAVIRVEHLMR